VVILESHNKSAHRRALSGKLDGRSDGSIGRKHQISAILIELGYPYIVGYKPLCNCQNLLAEVVAPRVATDRYPADHGPGLVAIDARVIEPHQITESHLPNRR
jgi:hypothetical protein